jgi:sugar O-acyltransferase (sialic acid O-acetyltransferase NeuD family)
MVAGWRDKDMKVAVYGAGGFAREVAWLAESCLSPDGPYEVVCFIDDDHSNWGSVLNDFPVMGLEEAKVQFPDAAVVGGIGSPRARQLTMEKAQAAGFAFATLVHPRAEHSRFVEFGPGTVVCAGNILTTNITLGMHIQINLDCTIGHDVFMGDFTTLAPGVHVSGWVHFGKRVYVGTGAVFINGTRDEPLFVADDAVVGAGACVTRSVESGTTVVGVPAKPIKRR